MQKDNYILIIASIPTKKNEKDGMVQREIAIDGLLADVKKIYIGKIKDSKIPFYTEYIRNPIRTLMYLPNKLDSFKNKYTKVYFYTNKKKFYNLCKNAKYIYCHSVYMVSKIPKEYIEEFKDKIIIDIHGCVPEEAKYAGLAEFSNKISEIENLAFNNVKNLIAVSHNMIDFYKNKYPNIKTNFINLPIFRCDSYKKIVSADKVKLKIVYSGGAQKWQNVEAMLETISKIANKFEIQILSGDIDTFNEKLERYGIEEKIELKSVSYSEIGKEYLKADFGFVLRDDIIVNRIACPTKIIEYLSYGIIPIVMQPIIGDFNNLKYSYILNKDLINGKIPDRDKIIEMVQNNYRVLNELIAIQKRGKKELLALIKDKA